MEFLRMSAKEYRNYIGGKSEVVKPENKYHAKKVEIDGLQFDSKFEGMRYRILKERLSRGEICGLNRQVAFVLQDGFVNNQGKKIRPITYVADFVYEEEGRMIVEDTKSKGTITEVYKIKKKLFEKKYPDYVFREVIK